MSDFDHIAETEDDSWDEHADWCARCEYDEQHIHGVN